MRAGAAGRRPPCFFAGSTFCVRVGGEDGPRFHPSLASTSFFILSIEGGGRGGRGSLLSHLEVCPLPAHVPP